MGMQGWTRSDSTLAAVVEEQTEVCLNVYREDPSRVVQDANNERRISQGGYATRQLEELLQNAVDAARRGGSQVEVLLTPAALYVANDGEPFDAAGIRSVMASDMSAKDDDRIGKFGIGFKSILAVSSEPKVFSRSVSFAFDKDWAEKQLQAAGFEAAHYPTMRLAKVLDPVQDGSARDAYLKELMQWATTVVVAPLSIDAMPLAKRLNDFPPEFVLFSAHIERARLRNEVESADGERKVAPSDRTVTREVADDGFVTLRGGQMPTVWSLARTMVHPTAAALKEAGHVAAREAVEVQYAVKFPPGVGLGRFWAYFPTQFVTTMSGIVNAPWKLSDDRLGLLEGRFNDELLAVVPRLVAEALARFSGTEHVVEALDALPSRGGELGRKEARNWVDEALNKPVFEHMRTVPSLPNGMGVLRRPSDLDWIGEGPGEWLTAWSQIPGAPVEDWLHPDAYKTQEQRVKVSRLMGSGVGADLPAGAAGVDEWLEALVRDRTVESSAHAIHLAARMFRDAKAMSTLEAGTRFVAEIERAKIIRLDDGDLKAPLRGRVFVRVEGQVESDVAFVDPELARMPGIVEDLATLGVVLMDKSGELRKLLTRWKSSSGRIRPEQAWPEIWRALRPLPLEAGIDILREDLGNDLTADMHVRTASGKWVAADQAFLGGRVVPADGSRDRDFLIDPREHFHDEPLLKAIGAVDAPSYRADAPIEAWFKAWIGKAEQSFIEHAGARIDPDNVSVDIPATLPWPLDVVRRMSDQAKAAVTKLLLTAGLPHGVLVRHRSVATYGRIHVIAPETHFLSLHGRFETTFGCLPPSETLLASDDLDPRFFPTVELSTDVAEKLGVPTELDAFPEEAWVNWKAVVDRRRTLEDDALRASFYAWLPGHHEAESLVVRVGRQRMDVPVGNIGVTSSQVTYESLVDAAIPALLVEDSEDLERFVTSWAMPRGEDLLQEEIISEPAGEPVYLTDAFPPLKLRLDPTDQDLLIQPVARLVRMTATPEGQVARPLRCRRDGGTLFLTADEPHQRLAQVSELLRLELDSAEIQEVLGSMERAASDKLRTKIKRCRDENERLVTAVGIDALRRSVPAQALAVLEERDGGVAAEEVAELARAVHGVGILKQLRPALDENGLEPPREWSGRRVTRVWVDGLGFPADWAGFPGSQRAAVEMIDGPAVLKPLHDYQEFVTERIEALLKGVGADRGMVSLPTGAGKTRVTVEALVKAVRIDLLGHDRPLVWIAQTDELCEQAAETWSYVWRAIGPQVPMRLGRLWGGNEVPEEPGTFQVVIATIDKLHSVQKRASDEYGWLREPSVVVIDEAHGSVSTSYTQVLEWMGRSGRGRSKEGRRPLLGLTATPFRGNSEGETERLVGRYDGNRLDRGAFRKEDPYEELQEMGVLAQVRHEILDGVDVQLSADDKSEIQKMGRLPASVSERLGADAARTRRVVESIASLPDDWTVLAFAPSVENARVLAALLAHRGVPAVAISADTEPAARRHYVEEFKAGRIRVLTNFNVLTQGFDAPKVQAVYVARPTFSPNVYQQMIGRGLRGQLNGGSEEVLIVNVRDNFDQYGDLLAFNAFEYLWTKR
ncbi:hypothetical protein N802_06875 [Knoellia sinensis KCTC 19936]|uniref:Helicase n=1 Tax=Knoellia sinensis KCTC 19936 TaxID=1385520 RepID=A0A0A0J1H6_9MICO|nr:DEAD/DEAH box helicase family protein [Knoellia sinensis]KGN30534.1 hypothetical protein N802_06875 [Knoellia sinensis KCTC 19936]